MRKRHSLLFFTIITLAVAGILVLQSNQKKAHHLALQLYFQGKSFVSQHLYDQAISTFHRALRLNPSHGMSYQMLGTAYDKKGEYKNALVFYNRALQLSIDPMETSRTHYNIGVIYRDYFKEKEKARKEFKLSIATHPPFVDKTFDPQDALTALQSL